ncbi:MAG: hypothetical protein K8S20_03385 [Chloroflexi bacterium]|nr:hypothetical protein [Chloroflexota bacterium]
MAKNQNKRLAPALIQADLDAYTAWLGISTYAPANAAYAKTAVTAKYTALKTAQDAELAAQVALATARDAATAAEWDFYNTLLGVKEQVIAQFGKSSDQVQSLGLKKKSEYKAPARRAKSA